MIKVHSGSVDFEPVERLFDLMHSDDTVLLCHDTQAAQSALNLLTTIVHRYRMYFSPFKCKKTFKWLQGSCTGALCGDSLEVVEKFMHINDCVGADVHVPFKIDICTVGVREAYLYLWRCCEISLVVKVRAYNSRVTATFLYPCETFTRNKQIKWKYDSC